MRALALATASATPSWTSTTRGSPCSTVSSNTPGPRPRYTVYYGEGRDALRHARPRRARVDLQHERRPVPLPEHPAGLHRFTTWTRGLAWIMLGYAEQLEFLAHPARRSSRAVRRHGRDRARSSWRRRAPPATSTSTTLPADGIPYWDTGAPGLAQARRLSRRDPPIRSTTTSRSTARRRRSPPRGCCGSGGISGRPGRDYTGRPDSPSVRSLLAEPYLSTSADPSTRVCSSTRSTTSPTAGTHVPRAQDRQWRVIDVGSTTMPARRALLVQRLVEAVATTTTSCVDPACSVVPRHRTPSPTSAWSAPRQCIEKSAAAGVGGITFWRYSFEGRDPRTVGQQARDAGLEVVRVARGGFFPALTEAGRRAAIDENRRAIDEAAACGAPSLVLVCGAVPGLPLDDCRAQIRRAACGLSRPR